MFCTSCVVCARADAKKNCARCGTVYCSPHCQQEHWTTGHKKKCKKIQRAGGAEQYHAEKKAKEATAEAVAACAADAAGKDCFLCPPELASDEGLVRACGRCGEFAHVSCLMERSRVAVVNSSQSLTCQHCGAVVDKHTSLAISWRYWKRLASEPKSEEHHKAMLGVARASVLVHRRADEISLHECCEASASVHRPASLRHIRESKLACLSVLGITDVDTARELYNSAKAKFGRSHESAFRASIVLMNALLDADRRREAMEFGEPQFRSVQRVFGRDCLLTVMVSNTFAVVLVDPMRPRTASREDLQRAEVILQETRDLARRHHARDGAWNNYTETGMLEHVRLRLAVYNSQRR